MFLKINNLNLDPVQIHRKEEKETVLLKEYFPAQAENIRPVATYGDWEFESVFQKNCLNHPVEVVH